jgi:uncharacterized membrane protein YqhA
MANLSNSSYPENVSNIVANSVLASVIGISSIAWFIQAIQSHFKPTRISIILLISHLTILVGLVLRTIHFTNTSSVISATIAAGALLAVGQRVIILSNYAFLAQIGDPTSCVFRTVILGTILASIGSAILTGYAGSLAYNSATVQQGIRLRQVSAAIVLCLTVFFYPIWFATKTVKDMTKQAITLLIISSFTCLIVAVFALVTLLPAYNNISTNQQQLFSYIFQFTPITIALLTWTIYHPKRSLAPVHQRQENIN